VEKPVQPLALAIATGATYVARGFSGEPKHLTKLTAAAIAHRGFSLIDVFSPCVTFNKVNTYPWFKERVYKLEEEKGYDPTNQLAALQKSLEFGSRIPIGCLYQGDRPTYEDSEPVLKKGPLVSQPLGLGRDTFKELLAETM
jgi:2-oxoglutarate ferredoxin oxidoreductase subunit beta